MVRKALGVSLLCTSFLVACGGPPPPVAPTASPQIESNITDTAATAAPGSELIGQLYRGVAYDRKQGQEWRLELEKGQCYFFVAQGDNTIDRLQFSLWGPDNDKIDSDKPKTNAAFLKYCPEVTGPHKFEAMVLKGAGHFAVGVYGKQAPEGPAAPDLDQMILTEVQSQAPGAVQIGTFFEGTGEKKDFYTALDKGQCYWFVGAASGTGVEDFYLYLWDADKKRVGETKAQGSKATFGHCATKSGMHQFQVKTDEVGAVYKVGVFAKEGKVDVNAGKGGNYKDVIAKEAASQAPGAKQVGEIFTGSTSKNDWYTQLEASKCYWFIGAGANDIEEFDIYLWDQGNRRVGENKADGNKTAFGHCPTETGMFHVQVKTKPASDFQLGVFGKKK